MPRDSSSAGPRRDSPATTTPSAALPEAVLQRVVLARLSALPGCHFSRINVVVARRGPRVIRSAPDGFPDVIGVAFGRAVALEFKSHRGVQSAEQLAWQRRWESAGGVYLLARDVDSVLSAVEALNTEARRA